MRALLWFSFLLAFGGLAAAQAPDRPAPPPTAVALPAPATDPDDAEECTVGVAAGRATRDGRPLLWKNRDAQHRDNVVRAFDDGRFPYVALCNAGATRDVWGGANAAGFCIMNSLSRDLTGDADEGPGNGSFMKLALMRCATVDEFAELLRETDLTGRRTRANFGVIDAAGAAAIFETGPSTHVRFDAEGAEQGIVVRTNFATTAGGAGGRERFGRVSELCLARDRAEPLDHRFLLREVVRDLGPPPSAVEHAAGHQDVRETIHRQTTVAAMVFHGVRPDEDPRGTTMWAVLGQPLFSVAVPCWPAAGATATEVAGDPRSALCDAALGLQAAFYETPADDDARARPDDVAGAIRWLRAAGLPALQARLLPIEDRILDATAARLEDWRAQRARDGAWPAADALRRFHAAQARTAVRAIRELAGEFAHDTPVRVVGRVTGRPDRSPWTLDVNGSKTAVEGDTFDVTVARADVYALHFDIAGCFPSLHTFGAPDVVAGTLDVPTVDVLERTPARRWLVFGGDTMLGRRYERPRAGEPVLVRAEHAADDARAVLRFVQPYLEPADLASVNLETQVFDTVPADATPKSVTFFSRPPLLRALADAGVDHVALGNNHVFDFGQPGLRESLEHLRASPLRFSGAGLDEASARRPVVLDVGGTPVAIHSYVGWRGTFDPHQAAEGGKGGAALGTLDALEADLRRSPADVVVFQYHGGAEYADTPSTRVETALKTAIDLGADVAIGHHPHVIQGFDLHRGRLCAYSLGNFLFDQYIYATQFGMLLQVFVDGEHLVRAEVVPLYVQGYVPTPATGWQRDAVLRRLVALTDPEPLSLTVSGAHLLVTPRSATTPQPAPIRVEVPAGAVVDLRGSLPPDRPVRTVETDTRVRLGVDLWRRGDLENHALFGSAERGWLADDGIAVVRDGGGHVLRVTTPEHGVRTVGMKTFERSFTSSADVTLRVRARAATPVTVDVFAQRRRDGDGLDEALRDGPREHAGTFVVHGTEWTEHRVDFAWPRLPTVGVRFFAEVRAASGATVDFDDFELIEWRSPPLEPGAPVRPRAPYTHLQRLDRGAPGAPVVLHAGGVAAAMGATGDVRPEEAAVRLPASTGK